MIIRYTILVSFNFVFLINFSICQTFEKIYRTSDDELVYGAALIDSTSCIFGLNSGSAYNDNYYTKIFKMDLQSGNLIDSLIIEPEFPGYYFRGIFDVLKVSDSLFIGIGKFKNNSGNEEIQYILHLNNYLKSDFDTIINIPEIEESSLRTIITQDSFLVSVGRTSVPYECLLCDKTIFGDSVRYEIYSHPYSYTASTVVNIPHKNKYHMFIYMGIEKAINIIDKATLERDTILVYPTFFLPNDAVPDDIDSSIYYVAGRAGSASSSFTDLFYLKLNDEGEILNQYTYNLDSNTFYAYKCFAPFNEHIYFAGVYPFTSSPPTMYPEARWILLYKLTKDGDVIWQKFYKGEVNYMAYKMLATNDGGAIVFSTKYDWNDPTPNQRDLHILKIDSSGYYTPLAGTEEQFEQMEKQILVYPNPVQNVVNFFFGLYKNLEINIYDINGNKVFYNVFEHSAIIDLSHLIPGIYLYTISGGNNFYEKGKLVKK
ncbi:MAG: T9SS type A sorting domain-containing protein [Bacteroidales bacterium]